MRKIARPVIFISLLLSFISVGLVGSIAYFNSSERNEPIVYAEKEMLLELWSDYKRTNIEPGTNRTLDKQQDNISTSEGQSYTMLRAVWLDDKKTFDTSWKWTKDNLQRDDFLLSWKFGRLPSGDYGIQDTVGGQNTATDGDSDIALSLLMAYSRWKQDSYLYDALPIISAMWEKEVVVINGKPVLVANDLERMNPEQVIINPSYFAPYAYKVFARVDKAHDWTSLASNSYEILNMVSRVNLDTEMSSGLPPDWVVMNRETGEITATGTPNQKTTYSFDAMRTPWRMALDYAWFQDARAKAVLENYEFLNKEWQKNNQILASYSHDGTPTVNYETPATYGGAIGYFSVIEPNSAADIYRSKLSIFYDPNEQKWSKPMSYYDDNWAWFGMALYLQELPNLTAESKT